MEKARGAEAKLVSFPDTDSTVIHGFPVLF